MRRATSRQSRQAIGSTTSTPSSASAVPAPWVSRLAAIAAPAMMPPESGRSSARAQPNRKAAIHATCAGSAVVSCMRTSRPKVAISSSSPESAMARP